MIIKLFECGSDDDELTQSIIDSLPSLPSLPHDALELPPIATTHDDYDYYKPARDFGYTIYVDATNDELYYLVK